MCKISEIGKDLLGCLVGEEVLCEIADSDYPGSEQVTDGQDLFYCTMALWYPLNAKRHWNVADNGFVALRRPHAETLAWSDICWDRR